MNIVENDGVGTACQNVIPNNKVKDFTCHFYSVFSMKCFGSLFIVLNPLNDDENRKTEGKRTLGSVISTVTIDVNVNDCIDGTILEKGDITFSESNNDLI